VGTDEERVEHLGTAVSLQQASLRRSINPSTGFLLERKAYRCGVTVECFDPTLCHLRTYLYFMPKKFLKNLIYIWRYNFTRESSTF
jgi:hypothetical protein